MTDIFIAPVFQVSWKIPCGFNAKKY